MTLNPAVLDALLAHGASAEMIVAAVKADLAEAEQRAARQIPWPLLRQMAFERDGKKCVWCQDEEGPFEVDHIIARANGGEDVLENVCVACRPCNRAKKDRGEDEWSDLAARRAKDRNRKRAERADNGGQSDDVQGQRGQSTDIPSPLPPLPPLKVSPDPNKITPPISPNPLVNGARAIGYHRLPEGWQPARQPPAELQAKLDQWPPGAFGDELASFKRWAVNAEDKNGKGRKLDWTKAFWNWIGRRHDEHYGRRGNQPEHPHGRTGAAYEAVLASIEAAESRH